MVLMIMLLMIIIARELTNILTKSKQPVPDWLAGGGGGFGGRGGGGGYGGGRFGGRGY